MSNERHIVQPGEATARSHAGFTLFELIVTVLVLAIIGALAAPRMTDAAPNRLREAAHLLAADIDFARTESLTHADDPRLIRFDTAGNRYHLAAASDPDTPIDDPLTRQPFVTVFGEGRGSHLAGVALDAVDVGGDDELGFGIYGQLDQPNDASVTMTAGGRRVTLTLHAASGAVAIGPIN